MPRIRLPRDGANHPPLGSALRIAQRGDGGFEAGGDGLPAGALIGHVGEDQLAGISHTPELRATACRRDEAESSSGLQPASGGSRAEALNYFPPPARHTRRV